MKTAVEGPIGRLAQTGFGLVIDINQDQLFRNLLLEKKGKS